MADDTTPDTDAATAPDESTTSQPDLGEAGKKALREERAKAREATKERDTLLARLKEFEDRDKTEAQKLAEAAETAQQRATAAESALARYRVAATKGVPADLVDRMRGSTEEELAEDADRLLELLGNRPPNMPSFDGGARTPAPASADMNQLLRQAAGRA